MEELEVERLEVGTGELGTVLGVSLDSGSVSMKVNVEVKVVKLVIVLVIVLLAPLRLLSHVVLLAATTPANTLNGVETARRAARNWQYIVRQSQVDQGKD